MLPYHALVVAHIDSGTAWMPDYAIAVDTN